MRHRTTTEDEDDDDEEDDGREGKRPRRSRDDDVNDVDENDDDDDFDVDEDDVDTRDVYDTDDAEAWYAEKFDGVHHVRDMPTALEKVVRDGARGGGGGVGATTRVEKVIARGFYGCDAEKILRECRDEENVPYDEQTISRMMEDLMERGKTIHAPFCFTRGALALKRAVHICHARGGRRLQEKEGFGRACTARHSECEIGVYISRAGGDVAEWHTDTNDNFTIQLSGSKLWEVGAYPKWDGSMTSNASLTDEPRCGIDYHTRECGGEFAPFARNVNASGIIPTGSGRNLDGVRPPGRYILGKGDCLTTQAGQYHRVTPIGKGLSISVNVRLTPYQSNVWTSELFFLRQSASRRRREDIIADMTPADELALRPRFGVFHVKHSDGLVLGFKYQPPRKSPYVKPEASGEYYMNPMCACSVARTQDGCAINIKCTSALTNKEYMNEFNLYVTIEHDEHCDALCKVFESPIAFNRKVGEAMHTQAFREIFDDVSETLRDMNVVINTMDVTEGCARFLKTFHD